MLLSKNSVASFLLVLTVLFSANSIRAQSSQHDGVWVGSWSAAQQIPEPGNALPVEDLRDATVRQIVHVSVGGDALRIHISNAFGTEPLQFTAVHIALAVSPASSAIQPGSDRALKFFGLPDVVVPAGAEYISDPLPYAVAPLSNLAVTFHLDAPPAGETSHPGSRATSYYVHGDMVTAAQLTGAQQVDHWYELSGVDVRTGAGGASVVAFGDSITDGHATTTNGNDRWTDVLATRLQASPATRNIGVLNAGIGGNHLLTDGLGPNALARFDRDVLAPSGAHWVIVLEGVNDLGALARQAPAPSAVHKALVTRILSAYQQILTRAHAHQMTVIGATIMPFAGSDYYHPDAAIESDRQAINAWIRAPGHFDDVLDFDKVVRNPQQPDHLLPAFDCGDHLHPDPAGYRAMAESIPLNLFAR